MSPLQEPCKKGKKQAWIHWQRLGGESRPEKGQDAQVGGRMSEGRRHAQIHAVGSGRNEEKRPFQQGLGRRGKKKKGRRLSTRDPERGSAATIGGRLRKRDPFVTRISQKYEEGGLSEIFTTKDKRGRLTRLVIKNGFRSAGERGG